MFASPEHSLAAASCVVMSCILIPGTEFCSKVRMLGGQGIMLTHSLACTERAGCASGSVSHTRFPSMRMAIGALIASPPHLSVSVRLDDDLLKMGVLGMIPLELQHWAEQADVWALLQACACALI